MGRLTVLWLLLAALRVALSGKTVLYTTDGGQLTIDVRPPFPDRIVDLVWRLDDSSLVVEWDEKTDNTHFYRDFSGRSTLSTSTGQLVINNMTKDDIGVYSVSINGKGQKETYMPELINPVHKPQVFMRPLTCSADSESCDAICGEDTVGAGPVTYSWKKGDGEWKESEKVLTITKTQDAGVKTLTCQIENPVSKKHSDPIDNKLYNPSSSNTGTIVPVVVVVVLLAIGAAVGGVLLAWKKKIGPFKDQSTNSTEPGNGHAPNHSNDAPDVRVPLNDNPKSDAPEE